MSGWNAALCIPCWEEVAEGRTPVRVKDSKLEVCSNCGRHTHSGIYRRIRPADQRYYTPEKDDRGPMSSDESIVMVGNGELAPWGNDRTCPICGEADLPLQDSVPPMLTFIQHCGETWLRGPIRRLG